MPLVFVTDEQLDLAKPRIMVGEQLQSWMLAHGLTRADVAKACLVDRRTVYRWIKGLNRVPRTVWPSLAQQFGEPFPHFMPSQIDPAGNEFAVRWHQQRGTVKEALTFEAWPQDD